MHRSDKRWPIYDRHDIDNRKRALLRDYFKTPEAQSVLGSIGKLGTALVAAVSQARKSDRVNTQRAYEGDQREFIAYCQSKDLEPMDQTEESWGNYFTDLSKRKNKLGERLRYRTIVRKAFSISNLFFQLGLPSPTRSFFHKQMMRKLARAETRRPKRARPLASQDLAKLIGGYAGKSLRCLRDKALAIIGGVRGWRASTIVGLMIENLEFELRGVVIGVLDIKTATGGELFFTPTPHTKNHILCLPCILKEYVDELRRLGVDQGPLFRPIDRWGNLRPSALTPDAVTDILRKGLGNAGVAEAQTYTSHSQRHGVVRNGVYRRLSKEEIMLITLHRSASGLWPYMVDIDPWLRCPTPFVVSDPRNDDPQRGWHHFTSV